MGFRRWFRDRADERDRLATWRYVGKVVARTRLVDDDGNETPGGKQYGYWVLRERGDGKRAAKKIGDGGTSAFATMQEAAVEAWLAGGPVPALDTVVPESSSEPEKPKAELIVFPGGKDAAEPNI